MNINKLLLGLNIVPIFSTFVFGVCIKTLVPEQYKSYIDGLLLVAIVILFVGPFVINYFFLRAILLPKQKMTYVILLILSLMVLINLISLIIMYGDQFETSRGFGLLGCGAVYLFVFLPLWVAFLVIFKSIKKQIQV